jgi:cytochrome P450
MSLPPKTRPDKYTDYSTREFGHHTFAGYDRMREQGPLSWQPAARGWLLTRYADSAKILRDPNYVETDLSRMWATVGKKLGKDYAPALRLLSLVPFQAEGDRHAQLRRTMARAVAPFAAKHELFRRRVDAMLKDAVRRGGCDFAEDFARDVLFQIFCDLMEVPEADRSEIREMARISQILESTLGVRERDRAMTILVRSMAYFENHAKQQLEKGSDCLVSRIYLEMAADEPDRLGAAACMCCIMLVMGNDALSSCLSQGVRQLLGEDENARQTFIPQAEWGAISDEVIRFAAPVDLMARIMQKDDTVAECPFKAGTRLLASAQAANHDPKQFGEKANEIGLAATGDIGLAFGAGLHLCIGNRISRNIAKAAMEALAQVPTIKLAGKARFTDGNVVRVVSSLAVTFG